MKRDKLIGLICVVLGLLILVCCLALVLHNRQQAQAADRNVQQALAALETYIWEPTGPEAPVETEPLPEKTQTETTPWIPVEPPSLTGTVIDGCEYVGYLLFPTLEKKLPVIRIRYLEDLQIAPCLERGSPYSDDAVISAHNYPGHFGPIRDWVGGEEVIFETLDGVEFHYTVELVQTIGPSDVEAVRESGYDLVLYTCTTGGEKRVMVACNKKAI